MNLFDLMAKIFLLKSFPSNFINKMNRKLSKQNQIQLLIKKKSNRVIINLVIILLLCLKTKVEVVKIIRKESIQVLLKEIY